MRRWKCIYQVIEARLGMDIIKIYYTHVLNSQRINQNISLKHVYQQSYIEMFLAYNVFSKQCIKVLLLYQMLLSIFKSQILGRCILSLLMSRSDLFFFKFGRFQKNKNQQQNYDMFLTQQISTSKTEGKLVNKVL